MVSVKNKNDWEKLIPYENNKNNLIVYKTKTVQETNIISNFQGMKKEKNTYIKKEKTNIKYNVRRYDLISKKTIVLDWFCVRLKDNIQHLTDFQNDIAQFGSIKIQLLQDSPHPYRYRANVSYYGDKIGVLLFGAKNMLGIKNTMTFQLDNHTFYN